MRGYRLSPHMFLEVFDQDAVLLLADRDVMVTINHAAAELFAQVRLNFAGKLFSRLDFLNLLLLVYEIDRPEAEHQVRSLLGFAIRHGLVMQRSAV